MKKTLWAAEEYAANPSPETWAKVQQSMSAAYSRIDKAVKTGALHSNNGSRKKASLSKAVKKLAVAAS